jgi:hypothetical protein
VCLSYFWSFVIHLPVPLRSARITRFQRYYEHSDFCLAVLRILTAAAVSPQRVTAVADNELRSFQTDLFVSCVSPSNHSHSNHPTSSVIAFTRYPSASQHVDTLLWASPLARRLATSPGRIEFTFVWDWSFAFRCFPPRLAATQFRSATSRRAFT